MNMLLKYKFKSICSLQQKLGFVKSRDLVALLEFRLFNEMPRRDHTASKGARARGDGIKKNSKLIQQLPDKTGDALVIDGCLKEGGGQVLRNASALSAITQNAVWIHRIRAGRTTPGLKPQHLAGLQLITDVCGGVLINGEIGSQVIQLQPSKIMAGKYRASTKTAGSCTLLAQSILPILLFATPTEQNTYSEVELIGGTDVPMAPPIDYLRYVLLPTLRRQFGIEAEIELVRRGFYPVGGGIVKLRVMPLRRGTALKPIDLMEPGNIGDIRIYSFAAGRFLTMGLEKKIEQEAVFDLRGYFGIGIQDIIHTQTTRELPETAVETGAGCCIVAESDTGLLFGGTGLFLDKSGRRVKKEEVYEDLSKSGAGSQAAIDIQTFIHRIAGTDDWMQDQLIIFMALAEGTSRIRVWGPSSHTETAILVAEQMTNAKFTVKIEASDDKRPPSAVITCQGIGLKRF